MSKGKKRKGKKGKEKKQKEKKQVLKSCDEDYIRKRGNSYLVTKHGLNVTFPDLEKAKRFRDFVDWEELENLTRDSKMGGFVELKFRNFLFCVFLEIISKKNFVKFIQSIDTSNPLRISEAYHQLHPDIQRQFIKQLPNNSNPCEFPDEMDLDFSNEGFQDTEIALDKLIIEDVSLPNECLNEESLKEEKCLDENNLNEEYSDEDPLNEEDFMEGSNSDETKTICFNNYKILNDDVFELYDFEIKNNTNPKSFAVRLNNGIVQHRIMFGSGNHKKWFEQRKKKYNNFVYFLG